jgi:cell division protein FtsZ
MVTAALMISPEIDIKENCPGAAQFVQRSLHDFRHVSVHGLPPTHAPAPPQSRAPVQTASTMQAPRANPTAAADLHETRIAELLKADNARTAEGAEMTEADHPEKRRLTLLQRLAAAGLGRHLDEQEPEQKTEPRAPESAKR